MWKKTQQFDLKMQQLVILSNHVLQLDLEIKPKL